MPGGRTILRALYTRGGLLGRACQTDLWTTAGKWKSDDLIHAQRVVATQACELSESPSDPSTLEGLHQVAKDALDQCEGNTSSGVTPSVFYGGSSGMHDDLLACSAEEKHTYHLQLGTPGSLSISSRVGVGSELSATKLAMSMAWKTDWRTGWKPLIAAEGVECWDERVLLSGGNEEALSSTGAVITKAKTDSKEPVVDLPPKMSSSHSEQRTVADAPPTNPETDAQEPHSSLDGSDNEVGDTFLRSEPEESASLEMEAGGGGEPHPQVRTNPEPGVIEYLQGLLNQIEVAFTMRMLKTAIERGFDLEDFKRGAEMAWRTFFEHYVKGDFDAVKNMVSPAVLKRIQDGWKEFQRQGQVSEKTLEHVQAVRLTDISWFAKQPRSYKGIPATRDYDPDRWLSVSVQLDTTEHYKKRNAEGNVTKSLLDKRGHTLTLARQLPGKLPVDELESPWYIVKMD